MKNYYLAIDIGASSGSHILGSLEDGIMKIEEVYRFDNAMKDMDGQLCWDVAELFNNVIMGMKKCKEHGKIPKSLGIDTWGVDFVLLDSEDKMVGNAVAYRDSRTNDMDKKVAAIMNEHQLYARSGIQKQIYNSIYQLTAVKELHPEELEKAESFLMIPDYLHFLLSGIKINEYTNATTTQLVNPTTKNWDEELISMIGLPYKIFQKIMPPGSNLGHLSKEIQKEVGFDCMIVLPATHDTGSAVFSVPSNESTPLYISSGTWSLMGIERSYADCSAMSRKLNFTNEGGYDYRFRYLKNIMGLWMIQCVKKEIGEDRTFSEICQMASDETITSIIDCDDIRFLSPAHMTTEVQNACRETNQQVPASLGEVAAVIYNSLAQCYRKTIQELEASTNENFACIHVVGGGSKADYLNELTARYTGKTVYAGPTEATSIGNIAAQMIASNELKDLAAARSSIRKSFEIKMYQKMD